MFPVPAGTIVSAMREIRIDMVVGRRRALAGVAGLGPIIPLGPPTPVRGRRPGADRTIGGVHARRWGRRP
ncbi:hypothetical protein GCM10023107_53390 [Actinoplanes octamycinicus]|nr:hypothetical protein Aoc01nite_48960 [Actinoplanes octamycinicus]